MFIIDKSNEHPCLITKLFVMIVFRQCMNGKYHVEHTSYGWNVSYCDYVSTMF